MYQRTKYGDGIVKVVSEPGDATHYSLLFMDLDEVRVPVDGAEGGGYVLVTLLCPLPKWSGGYTSYAFSRNININEGYVKAKLGIENKRTAEYVTAIIQNELYTHGMKTPVDPREERFREAREG